MNRDHEDALMEQLLREMLGGDRPRDMTARVLSQARLYDRFRRRWWIAAGAAVAAGVVLAASVFQLWPRTYPGYEVHGVAITNGNEPQPGATLQTDDITSGNLRLGGYVDVIMRPQTALTLGGGTKFREKVFLEQGELQVAVRKNMGKFEIGVGPATVNVTGTRFNVNVTNSEAAGELSKKLHVSVDEGSVEIHGIPGQSDTERLSAGDKKEFVIFYTPKVIPPVNPALRAGLLAAAQEGARTGRGGGAGKSSPEQLLNRGVLPPMLTGQNRPAKLLPLIVHTGSGAAAGRLRREHDLYYLETTQGAALFMFPQAAAPDPAWPLPVGQSVKVFWEEGRVTSVNP
jgi:ferric-dicitrate binding protein FerR (iron transport regulator)